LMIVGSCLCRIWHYKIANFLYRQLKYFKLV